MKENAGGCLINTPQANNGDQCPAAGNPINIGSGNKFQRFNVELNNDVTFSLFYNSYTTFSTGSQGRINRKILGRGWFSNFELHIGAIATWNFVVNSPYWGIGITRSDGRVIWFYKLKVDGIQGEWNRYRPERTKNTRLIRNGNTWEVYAENGTMEVYRLIDWDDFDPISYYEPYYAVISKMIDNNGKQTFHTGNSDSSWPLRVAHLNDNIVEAQFTLIPDSTGVRLGQIKDLKNPSRMWTFVYDTQYNNLIKIIYPDSTETIFHYLDDNSNRKSLLSGITDRRNIRYSTYGHDAHGFSYSSELAGGVNRVTVGLSISNDDFFTRIVTDSFGRQTTYELEKRFGLFKVLDVTGPGCSTCSNGSSHYEYDNNNNITLKTIDGVTTTYDYSQGDVLLGQYSSKTIASGTAEQKTIGYTWDSLFHTKPKTITEPSIYSGGNKVITYTYNTIGQMTSKHVSGFKPDGTTASQNFEYEYNGPFNQISLIKGPRVGSIDDTIYEYYSANHPVVSNQSRLLRVKAPGAGMIGNTEIIERNNIQWSSTGKILSEDLPNGVTINNVYYANNDRLKQTTLTDGSTSVTTYYTYLATGEIKTLIQNYGTAIASTTTFTYDDARRLIRRTDGLGNYTVYELDTESNLLSEKTFDSTGGVPKLVISNTYDAYNRLDARTQSGSTVDYNYANNGTLSDKINGNGIVTDYSYDGLNRLNQISRDFNSPNPSTVNTVTAMTYNSQDRVETVTDANGYATSYQYDDIGNLSKLTSPDTGVTDYTYDASSNLVGKQDGISLNILSYDGRNRLVGDYKMGLTHYFSYDEGANGIGQLTSFTDSSGSTSFNYNAFGLLLNKTQNVTGFDVSNYVGFNLIDTEYNYDSYNRLEKMTYPSGMEITYFYDGLNRIEKISTSLVKTGLVNIADQIQYLPNGPIESVNYGKSQNYSASYDDGYRLNGFSYGTAITANYSFDGNSNITAIQRETSANDDLFSYDRLDRLTNDLNGSNVFTYDKLGNRETSQEGAGPVVSYTYANDSNRLFQVGTAATRSYDGIGSTTSTPDNDGLITYNNAGRMATYSNSTYLQGEYFYNAIGQRVIKTKYKKSDGTLAGEFLYLYDRQGQLIHESKYKNGDHKWDRETIWLYNRPVAQVRTLYSAGVIVSQNIYYIQVDHLNTPRWVTDSTGTILWSWESDAFGTTLQNKDADGDGTNFWFQQRFPGQFWDSESGQHYNYFRDYEPGTGRYIESDPIGLEGGWNTYVFTHANPVNYFDSNGAQTEGALATCAIGGPFNPACDVAIIINACKYIGIGIAAAWGYFSSDANDCDDGDCEEMKRCKKVSESCISGCSDFVLGKPSRHRPSSNGWSGDDFSTCVKQCMENAGCA
ncbi:MAG: RHS domain-containing protein [Proteobacteria bacterium]|nr:RHS domain-containing protein [Pseudomonadota bacterium]